MHCKDFFVDDSGDRQAIKTVRECFPQFDVVPTFAWKSRQHKEKCHENGPTFIIKPVNSVDTRTLVISSQNKEIFRVFDLIGKEEANGLERLFTPVNVVTKEKVVGFWREPSVLEKTEKVVVLSMNVACLVMP